MSFYILANITVYVRIGQLLPHGSPFISDVDTSSNVTRVSSLNQVKAHHTVELKERSLTQAKTKYQIR